MIYDPSDQVVYVGAEGSSHGALMTEVPKLHDELTNYDNDIFGRGNIGYYHYYSNPSIPGHNVYHLTGGRMSPELEEEVKQTMRRVRTSAVDPENNPDIAGFRSWIYMDGYLYMAKQNAENHQDLADKYDIRPEDWVTKPFVVGVIWPQENNFGVVTAADINLYSDYLDELSQDSYDEDSDEYENLNERNRKEGQILVRALTAVYEWWSDNFPAIPLTVNGVSIEEYLPFSDVTSNNAKIAMTTTYVPASSDPWHSGDGISYAYDITNDALYWTDGHHPDIYEHVVQEIKHDYSYPPLDNFI